MKPTQDETDDLAAKLTRMANRALIKADWPAPRAEIIDPKIQAMVDKTIRHLARIHPGFRFVRDESCWVVFCRDHTWRAFNSWPRLTNYAEEAMRRAKVPAALPLELLRRHLIDAMRAGPPIAVASRDDLPRNPFIGLRMAKARRHKAAAAALPADGGGE